MGRYPNCPSCGKDIKVNKIYRLEADGFVYHSCYKCDNIFEVTPA
ncbi:putative C2H2 Zn-finger protein [Halolamina salifodinae]|uniref:Putative C2H2 Zn-finger protein n=1 Tax=Halolamina salifodinae TaxID=1202767 RepID=A0A8T4GV18_9EURY|nr:putative C2H2 Zn-finger protein [Halolamina salifodinae]